MNDRLRIPAAIVLIAMFTVLTATGISLGLQARGPHDEDISQPWHYLASGGAYIALGVMCAIASAMAKMMLV